jgi:hypothetical protein
MIDLEKKYRRRDGQPVILYRIENSGAYPVVGTWRNPVYSSWVQDSWSPDGAVYNGHVSPGDLVEIEQATV